MVGKPAGASILMLSLALIAGGVAQTRAVTVGSKYISQNPPVQHFGLGTAGANGAQSVTTVHGILPITQAP